MQMEHARQNKKRANKGQWYHGLAWRLTMGSPFSRRQPELIRRIRLPQQQGAESTGMAMHAKANRGGLPQRTEAAT